MVTLGGNVDILRGFYGKSVVSSLYGCLSIILQKLNVERSNLNLSQCCHCILECSCFFALLDIITFYELHYDAFLES